MSTPDKIDWPSSSDSRILKSLDIVDHDSDGFIHDGTPDERPAPNKTVATSNFANWFNGSKAVDADGNPLILYHGTDQEQFNTFENRGGIVRVLFSEFKVDRSGFFFSPNKEVAESFGDRTEAVYLSIKNPADMTTSDGVERIAKELASVGVNEKWFWQVESWEMFDRDPGSDDIDIVEKLKELGYDGAVIDEPAVEGEREDSIAWVAFDPEQIKSATRNSGSFDPTSPDITKSIH